MSVRAVHRWRRSVLLASILVTALGMIGYGGIAIAQDQPQDQPADQQQPQPTFKEEVEVTGTLIPRPTLEAMSPVSTLEPEQIQASGKTRLEDLLISLPQVFAAQNSTVSNGSTGTANVNLRNLGINRTLILVDGKRMPPGDVGAISADLNFIPAFLVKRIDVLTGGASSVYGADAVAGVVNFIMDREFEGLRAGVQYNIYQHDNRNELMRRILAEGDYYTPKGSTWDGGSVDAYAAFGGSFAEGKGHATAYVEYRKTNALLKAERDYTACSVGDLGDTGPYCGGSSTNPFGRFQVYNADFIKVGDWTLSETGGVGAIEPYATSGHVYNYGAVNFLQRPDVRWSAGGYLDYKWNEHFQGYLDVMLMDDITDAQIAPSGDFGETQYINCDNPLLSEEQYQAFCVDAGWGPDEDAIVYVLRRNVEGGGRNSHYEHTAYRLVAGVKGDIDKNWSYDFYGLYGQVVAPEADQNYLNSLRIQQALFVVTDNDPESATYGQPICRDATAVAQGCVPWNIFELGGVTQAALDYLSVPLLAVAGLKTQVVSAKINGDLEDAGVKFPSASEGVKVALGAEYRKEELYQRYDFAFQQGIGAGLGGQRLDVAGSYRVKELFGEALVPVIQDVPGAQDLSLELGYRYSDYSTTGGANTWKAQASYTPVAGYKIRVGYNRATRSPNVTELFRPAAVLLEGSQDPCEGDAPTATLEQCERSGMTAAQYGNVAENSAHQYNALLGGNPNLEQEIGKTQYAGIVLTPPGLAGFTAALDYFKVKIDNAIDNLNPDTILLQCLQTGDPTLCGKIHRDPAGTLWLTPAGYTDSLDENVAAFEGEGIDVSASYLAPIGNSFLNFNLMGTYLLHLKKNTGFFEYDCVGLFGDICAGEASTYQPAPRWRHRFQVSWETGKLTATLGWRMDGAVTNDASSNQPGLYNPDIIDLLKINGSYHYGAFNYFDLSATYDISKHVQFTLGVDNVLDKEPPLGVGNQSNDYAPGFYGFYDPYGRFIHSALVFTF